MVHQFMSDLLTALHPPNRFVNHLSDLQLDLCPILLGVPCPSSIIETCGSATPSPLPCTLIILPFVICSSSSNHR
ncbi:hypothetical protein CY34DRAFT_291686 [Suillus luteus UH-Slu-Lm8-n1]|uniref:Uncharacterized protein n=1 Tax=Suillus luteus UH-Slu-Lm8-n1 TaxID=930992 RepID=A0A0D0AA53_9AGAM|nr:hypothetical protein CY34DRAFT_291686 [Suillus luteus UH-Slu-Lm8-n1]